MKSLDKFILFVFSTLFLVAFILGALKIGGIYDPSSHISNLEEMIRTEEPYKYAAMAIVAILTLFAIKGMLFQAKPKKEQDGIMLENNSGKLLISRQTLEKLVSDLSKDIPGTESATAKILINKDNNLVVMTDVVINKDAAIKDVSKRLQEEVRVSLKQASDLDVEEVNVNVAGISSKNMSKEHRRMLEEYQALEAEATDSEDEEVSIKEEVSEELKVNEAEDKKEEK